MIFGNWFLHVLRSQVMLISCQAYQQLIQQYLSSMVKKNDRLFNLKPVVIFKSNRPALTFHYIKYNILKDLNLETYNNWRRIHSRWCFYLK